jgi:hypothetical protein
MKKLISILILCLACYSAVARNLMVVGGGVPVAGGCTTSNDSSIFDYTGSGAYNELYIAANAAIGSGGYWIGQQFTLAANKTITALKLDTKYSVQTGNIVCSIYTNSATIPGTQVSGTEVTLLGSITTTTIATYEMALSTPKTGLTSGTTYWMVCTTSHADSNFRTFSTETTGAKAYTGSGTYVTTENIRLGVYGCTE